MRKISLLVMVCLVFLFSACKKQKQNGNELLYGSWRLIEVDDKWANGGVSGWHPASQSQVNVLLFTVSRKFTRQQFSNGVAATCSGSYQLRGENRLNVFTNCLSEPELFTISELNSHMLILEQSSYEGPVRYKYESE